MEGLAEGEPSVLVEEGELPYEVAEKGVEASPLVQAVEGEGDSSLEEEAVAEVERSEA